MLIFIFMMETVTISIGISNVFLIQIMSILLDMTSTQIPWATAVVIGGSTKRNVDWIILGIQHASKTPRLYSQ